MTGTHLLIIKNIECYNVLTSDDACCSWIANAAKRNEPMEFGDCAVARDELLKAGYVFGEDFWIKKQSS